MATNYRNDYPSARREPRDRSRDSKGSSRDNYGSRSYSDRNPRDRRPQPFSSSSDQRYDSRREGPPSRAQTGEASDSRYGSESNRGPVSSPQRSALSENKLLTAAVKAVEALAEKIKIQTKLDRLEEAQREKLKEYEKSMNKYADFPSVRELNARSIAQAKNKVEEAQGLAKTNQAVVEKAVSEALDELRLALPDMKSQHLKSMDSDISQMKNTLRQYSENHKTHAKPLREELKTAQKEISELREELHTLRRERQEPNKNKANNETMLATLREELGEQKTQLEAQFRLQLKVQRQESAKDLENIKKSQDAEIAAKVEAEVTKQLENIKNSHDAEIAAKVEAEVTKKLEKRGGDAAKIREEVDRQTADIKKLLKNIKAQVQHLRLDLSGTKTEANKTQLDDFPKRLHSVEEIVSKLQKDVANMDDQNLVQSVGTSVDDFEKRVLNLENNLDVEVLNEWAEYYAIHWNTWKEAVESNIQGLRDDLDSVLADRANTQANHPPPQPVIDMSHLITKDSFNEVMKALVVEPEDFDIRTSKLVPKSYYDKTNMVLAVEMDKVSNRVKEQKDDLTERIKEQKESLKQLTDRVDHNQNDFKGSHDYLMLCVNNLNHQFNNLTTKEMSESIVRQMEQIYPTPNRLANDIHLLTAHYEQLAHDAKRQKKELDEVKKDMKGPDGVRG